MAMAGAIELTARIKAGMMMMFVSTIKMSPAMDTEGGAK